MSMQNMKRSETTEQIALFNWAKRTESILPELALMYHVPNEGKRSNGGILKAAGLKSGVPDICLPVANNGFHGLYIELKFGKNKATKAQEEYMAMLNAQGYKTAVCYGAEEAGEEILAYLTEPGRMPKKACVNAPWINGKCDGIARNSISKKVEFMTKFCNIKQNSAVAWLDYWDVMKCVHEEKPLSLEDFKGCYCVGGIDLSRTTDLTAASIVINRDGINHIFTRFYMPQKRYEVAINEDNTPYNIYRDRGFLFISGENQVDYKDVYNWFIELVKVYKIKPLKIGYDRYSANYLVEDLKTAGFHTDDVYQGTNLTPVLHEFEGNLKDGLFDFGDNSMLAAHFLNVAVDINLNDSRMKPVKIEKRMRIDGAMSVFDALTMVSKYHNEIGKKLLNISKETA